MIPDLSVILCTHNPRLPLLQRVLRALRAQTLSPTQWELIIVDNNSAPPVILASEDSDWHPHLRLINEPQQGLTHARACGIKASRADLLVFVDDDNILRNDYLERALAISQSHPFLGAWGGSIEGEFGCEPPPWTRTRLDFLAVRPCHRSVWTSEYYRSVATPNGAGMCVRKWIAEDYLARVAQNPLRALLDRSGDDLISGGDIDLANTAIDNGLGVGVFADLVVTHVIPPGRFTEEYFLRLAAGLQASFVITRALRGIEVPPPFSRRPLLRIAQYVRTLLLPRMDRRIRFAMARGHRRGSAMLLKDSLPG